MKKYEVTRTVEYSYTFEEKDLSKERIAILEAWASGDEDALDEFKDSSMFIDLDVHVDSDEYDIKKVEE